MKPRQCLKFVTIVGMVLALCCSAAAQQGAKKEHQFRGKVEGIDAKAKTLTVNGEKVDGWMAAMTMNYKVDKEDVLKKVKIGDQITATVYDGDFMTLHDVHVASDKDGKAPSGK